MLAFQARHEPGSAAVHALAVPYRGGGNAPLASSRSRNTTRLNRRRWFGQGRNPTNRQLWRGGVFFRRRACVLLLTQPVWVDRA